MTDGLSILTSGVDYVAYAVPFFFLLIGLEVALAALAGKRLYRIHDSVSDLGCGMIDQVLKALTHAVVLGIYIWIYENHRIFEIAQWSVTAQWVAAISLFIAIDFCFYWHHRLGHVWSTGWAAHVVHHSSEEFNLVVALRQSALEHHLLFFVYLPLALLGCPVSWYVTMFSINLLWQFWVHTRLVGKLGPLEWIFNTPSHHRVHHGRNPQYLDKNYGGVFIIWDRLLGTFEEEIEEPVYGITKPLESWNPLWANVHQWWEMAREAWLAPYWWDKVRLWFMPLNWTPRGLPPKPDPPAVTVSTVKKFRTRTPRPLLAYAIVHFIFALFTGLLLNELALRGANPWSLWDLAAFILITLACVSGVLERKRWLIPAELARLGAFCLLVIYRAHGEAFSSYAIAAAVIAALASGLFILAHRHEFREPAVQRSEEFVPASL